LRDEPVYLRGMHNPRTLPRNGACDPRIRRGLGQAGVLSTFT
jgi:hypothetical protein